MGLGSVVRPLLKHSAPTSESSGIELHGQDYIVDHCSVSHMCMYHNSFGPRRRVEILLCCVRLGKAGPTTIPNPPAFSIKVASTSYFYAIFMLHYLPNTLIPLYACTGSLLTYSRSCLLPLRRFSFTFLVTSACRFCLSVYVVSYLPGLSYFLPTILHLRLLLPLFMLHHFHPFFHQ